MKKFFNNKAWMILTIVGLGFLAYGLTLNAPFKSMDDQFSIIQNERIKDVAYLEEIFTSSFFGGNHYYRPLVYVSFMLEYHFFGLNPLFYHLTNVLLHLLIAVLVFFLIHKMTKKNETAFFVSLLFAIHPINSEVVWNIPDRSIILNALFSIGAFLLFIIAQKQRVKFFTILGSLLCFMLALLSKESAAILPVVLVMYTLFTSQQKRHNLTLISLYFLVVIGFIIFRKQLGIVEIYAWESTELLMFGFLTFLSACLDYLRLFIVPIDLYFDRSKVMYTSVSDPGVIATFVIIGLLLVTLFCFRRSIPKLGWFFVLWFVFELAPVSQIVTSIGVTPGVISTAEHFLYLASIGMFGFLVLIANKIYEFNQRKSFCSEQVFQFSVIGLCSFYFFMALVQSIYAINPIALFKRSFKFNPHNARVINSLANEYVKRGDFAQAEYYFHEAIKVEPTNPRHRIGEAKAICDQGRYVDCIRAYENIIDPGRYHSLLEENIRLSYEALINQYKEEIDKEPDNLKLRNSLGLIYVKRAQMSEAIVIFEEALQLNPEATDVMINLAKAYESNRQMEQAASYYSSLLKMNQATIQQKKFAYTRLYNIYNAMGQNEKAELYIEGLKNK